MSPSRSKFVILIPDGAADLPVESLGGKTPLETARMPALDALSERSEMGLSSNIPEGFIPGTDVGCMSIFGYDPARFYTGRGPLEAAQLGVALKGNDLAFRCNLVTEEKGVLKDYSADHVSVQEARAIFETLNRHFKDLPVNFYPGMGTGYRNLMILHGPAKAAEKLKLSAPHDIMGGPIERYLPSESEEKLLRRLMLESRDVLRVHPVNAARARAKKGAANMIWLWGQGRSPKWPTYPERFGKRGAVITAVDLVKGIGIFAGLDVINVPGVTGFFDTNYSGKAQYALKALSIRDCVFVHIESTDEAGHMGRADLKIKALEDIDRQVVAPLAKGLSRWPDHRILVVPDHLTCVSTRTHAREPVPYLLYANRRPARGYPKFCEKTARAAVSGNIKKGHELIELLFRD